uniref:Ribosomal_S7 domain-containing protein n=1 Tax=Haemonchus contortus TaxID=6289 RepID=A0A7I4Y3F9_HAECO
MNGKIPVSTTSMKNTTGSSNIFTIVLEKQSPQVAKRRLSLKTLELIRQRGIARTTSDHRQTSELAKLCREAIKEDLKERTAAVMDEAANAGKSIRIARWSFASYKTKMTSFRCHQLLSVVINPRHQPSTFPSHPKLPIIVSHTNGS